MTQQKSVDPAIRAARITRTGTVVAAIAAALITAIATGVTAYIVGHKEGVSAAPTVTVHETTTVTESAQAASETGNGTGTSVAKKPTGGSSLLLLTANETQGEIVTDPQKVNSRDYDHALTGWLGMCNYTSAHRVYQLDRKYKRLQADVGLTDNTKSGSVVVFKVVLDDVPLDTRSTRRARFGSNPG